MGMHQTNINALASAAKQIGVKDVVICPGSRNAPLVMAFWRINAIKCHSIVDERSAAFVALGLAKSSGQTVVMICTSGSALVNFYPAILEAFYSEIPLMVLSADRPPEWIDQWDGQAIHQKQIFVSHVKWSEETSCNDELNPQAYFKLMLDGLQIANSDRKGPVHLNVPLREPLYEATLQAFEYPEFPIATIPQIKIESAFQWPESVVNSKQILVVHGADHNSKPQLHALQNPVLTDIIANKLAQCNVLDWEKVLMLSDEETLSKLQAEVLITTGKMVVSKPLKQFLRKYKPKFHFHITDTQYCADPFQTNPIILHGQWDSVQNTLPPSPAYLAAWQHVENALASKQLVQSSEALTEPNALAYILHHLPHLPMGLHFANSMSVRWASMLLPLFNNQWQVFANRGVSGIDGCTSTALGMALNSNHTQILFTGDLAFAYDNNAWFQSTIPKQLKVVIFNNFGGGIFDQIEGPRNMPEKHLVQTPHKYRFELMAKHYQINYALVQSAEDLAIHFEKFLNSEEPSILEIQTNNLDNYHQLQQYKQSNI